MDNTFAKIQQLMQIIHQLNEELEITDEILESLDIFDENELIEEKKWIQDAIKKPGALRKSLKVKKGQDIPEKKLEAAAKKKGKLGQRARLALKLREMNKKK